MDFLRIFDKIHQKLMERSFAAQIGKELGKEIRLCGFIISKRDHGSVIFADLKDLSGYCQIVFLKNKECFLKAKQLNEWDVVEVRGKVNPRPKGTENPKIESGAYEVEVNFLEILSKAKPLPFSVDDEGYQISEELRLKYRYLDLRRPRLQRNLKIRHQIFNFIREFFSQRNFIEIETPILSKSTPEGARDYLVPSRIYPGKFFALPQSPQQYKQLLMVAGFERYFQIARCFRDEDLRGDRQPEFTQLDLEISFTSEKEILELVKDLMLSLIKKFFPQKKVKFYQLSYQEAQKNYQTDKPDLRENKEDKDELAFCFLNNFPMFEWDEREKRFEVLHHPFTLPKLVKEGKIIEDKKEILKALKEKPETLLSWQYDLVLNGEEIGGGSIRSNDPEILISVFEVLGYQRKEIEEKFSHLIEAFKYGVPPHGGIALGLDRLLAILLNEPSIREVIAFPKSGKAADLMTQTPSKVEKDQLKELHLEIKNES